MYCKEQNECKNIFYGLVKLLYKERKYKKKFKNTQYRISF